METGDSPAGNARRVQNAIASFPKRIVRLEKELEEQNTRFCEIRKALDHPDGTNRSELALREKELEDLKRLIRAKNGRSEF